MFRTGKPFFLSDLLGRLMQPFSRSTLTVQELVDEAECLSAGVSETFEDFAARIKHILPAETPVRSIQPSGSLPDDDMCYSVRTADLKVLANLSWTGVRLACEHYAQASVDDVRQWSAAELAEVSVLSLGHAWNALLVQGKSAEEKAALQATQSILVCRSMRPSSHIRNAQPDRFEKALGKLFRNVEVNRPQDGSKLPDGREWEVIGRRPVAGAMSSLQTIEVSQRIIKGRKLLGYSFTAILLD